MKASELRLSVLVPAYNEEHSIQKTVDAIAAQRSHFADLEIVVINDGSKDQTGAIAKTLPVSYIEHPRNRGYGAALKTGLRAARHDYILIVDADGTYPLEDIPRLAEHAGEYGMVVGARTGDSVHIPLVRRPAKWAITRLAEYLSGCKIPDLNSGFRIFRKQIALEYLPLFPDGFSFTTTITLAMLTNFHSVLFLPINYHRRVGKSSIHPIRDTINFTILIIRICAYFKPLNVFVPPALLLMLGGLAKGTRDYLVVGHVGVVAMLAAVVGFQMLFIGLLADLIDKRMKL
jgi:glycosyltransferase involved in cell wall biosynthesis